MSYIIAPKALFDGTGIGRRVPGRVFGYTLEVVRHGTLVKNWAYVEAKIGPSVLESVVPSLNLIYKKIPESVLALLPSLPDLRTHCKTRQKWPKWRKESRWSHYHNLPLCHGIDVWGAPMPRAAGTSRFITFLREFVTTVDYYLGNYAFTLFQFRLNIFSQNQHRIIVQFYTSIGDLLSWRKYSHS